MSKLQLAERALCEVAAQTPILPLIVFAPWIILGLLGAAGLGSSIR